MRYGNFDGEMDNLIESVFGSGKYNRSQVDKVVRTYSEKLLAVAKTNLRLNKTRNLLAPTDIGFRNKRASFLYNIMNDEENGQYSLFIVDHFKPLGVIVEARPHDLPIIKSLFNNVDKYPVGRVLITYESARNPLQLLGQDSFFLNEVRANIQFQFRKEISKSSGILYISTCGQDERTSNIFETPITNHVEGYNEEQAMHTAFSQQLPAYQAFNPEKDNNEFIAPYHALLQRDKERLNCLRPFIGIYPHANQDPKDIGKTALQALEVVSKNLGI